MTFQKPNWIDRLGFAASAMCALHCLLLPAILLAIPALSGSVWASERLETYFVGSALLFALASVLLGWRKHRANHPLLLWLMSLVLFAAVAFAALEHGGIAHAVFVSAAGGALALAHWVNARLLHRHHHANASSSWATSSHVCSA
jgi:MerC mercury resistance protein